MNRFLPLALLIAGITLLIFGINAHGSLTSGVKEVLTGTPTDKSLWFIVLGSIGVIVGGLGTIFRRSIS